MKEYKIFKSNYELAKIACDGTDCFCIKTNTKAEYDVKSNILTMTDSCGQKKYFPQISRLIIDKKGRSRMLNFRPFIKEIK